MIKDVSNYVESHMTTALVWGIVLYHARKLQCLVRHNSIVSTLQPILPNRGGYVAQALARIMEEDHKAGRPLSTAVVVGETKKPGEGFFNQARKLGYEILEDETSEARFWWSQLQKFGITNNHTEKDSDVEKLQDMWMEGAKPVVDPKGVWETASKLPTGWPELNVRRPETRGPQEVIREVWAKGDSVQQLKSTLKKPEPLGTFCTSGFRHGYGTNIAKLNIEEYKKELEEGVRSRLGSTPEEPKYDRIYIPAAQLQVGDRALLPRNPNGRRLAASQRDLMEVGVIRVETRGGYIEWTTSENRTYRSLIGGEHLMIRPRTNTGPGSRLPSGD